MAEKVCPQCGAPINPGTTECKFCGEKLVTQQMAQQVTQQSQVAYTQQPQLQVVIQQASSQQVYVSAINPAWTIKNKVVSGVFGIFLGGIGVHKFYK